MITKYTFFVFKEGCISDKIKVVKLILLWADRRRKEETLGKDNFGTNSEVP